MFPSMPSPALITTKWVCSKCGSTDTDPQFGALMDPRYAVGYCNSCTDPDPPKPRKTPRPKADLVREDAFDRAAFEVRRDRERLKELIHKYGTGIKDDLTMNQLVDLIELYDMYGSPGWSPTAGLRKQYDDEIARRRDAHAERKVKKGRGA